MALAIFKRFKHCCKENRNCKEGKSANILVGKQQEIAVVLELGMHDISCDAVKNFDVNIELVQNM